MDDFYSRVKRLADGQKITLRNLLVSLDLNYDTYYSQKALKNLPRLDNAVRIAKALGTTVEHLVEGTSTPKEHSLLDAYNKLDETGKQAAIGAVQGLGNFFPQRPNPAKRR
jgi:hypothetical protein